MNRKSAQHQMRKYVLPKNDELNILKKTAQKVQATTSKRTNINLAQQFRWHTLVEDQYAWLRETNTGLCPVTKKTFGELMRYFIIGLDKMCIMSDAHGNLHVIASADKKKHEKLLQDCRCSITLVRTGVIAGTTGPTIFLLKGTKKWKEFTGAFLEKHGCAKGSTIVMTKSAYMTDEAWLLALRAIVRGCCQMPHVKDSPYWWMLELIDVFFITRASPQSI